MSKSNSEHSPYRIGRVPPMTVRHGSEHPSPRAEKRNHSTSISTARHLFGLTTAEQSRLKLNTLAFAGVTTVVIVMVGLLVGSHLRSAQADTAPEEMRAATTAAPAGAAALEEEAVVQEPTALHTEHAAAPPPEEEAPKPPAQPGSSYYSIIFFTASSAPQYRHICEAKLKSLPREVIGDNELHLEKSPNGKYVYLCAGRFEDKDDPRLIDLLQRIRGYRDGRGRQGYKDAYRSKINVRE